MSRYSNYVMKNNVFAELDAPISSLATTIQLKTGQGARRGTTFPILATLESFDSDGKCIKREIVRITAISGDNLTVVRGVAPCPSSDDSNSQGTTTFSFGADDKISLYIAKEHFDKIEAGFENTNDEIDDILENGDNKLRTYKTTGLGVEVKGGPVLIGSSYYDFAGGTLTLTDDATNYIEIDEDGLLVVNTTGRTLENTKISKVITSGGEITDIEDWRLGTIGGKIGGLDIHELTEKQQLAVDDEFVIADSENIYQNKKIKINSITPTIIDGYLYGDGSDGCCHITTDCANSLDPNHNVFMEAKEYNFTNFIVDNGVILRFCGEGMPIIKVRNCFCNMGTINTRTGPLCAIEKEYMFFGHIMQLCNIGSIGEITQLGGCGGSSGAGAGGGPGENGCANGGNGALCAGGGGGSPCGRGGDATDYCGGNGATGGNYAGGGGGGYGLLKGGNGGGAAFREHGGGGGDSYYGDGGNSGGGGYSNCYGSLSDGGNSYFGNGGNGSHKGGNSYYGNGGSGNNSVSDGGDGCSYAGNGGGTNGHSLGGAYGLMILAPNIFNNCIHAKGGNGGSGGGCAGSGGYVNIIYRNSLDQGCIDVSAGCGCNNPTDGCLTIIHYDD